MPSSVTLRPAVRALVLDEDERLLMCRFTFPDRAEKVVWAAPGGGIEPGEPPLTALSRELHEEIGLAINTEPPHVWHQEVIAPGHASGYDGVINDYFLVRVQSFIPRGALTDEELAAENISGFKWWTFADIASYRGSDLFSPRDLATPLEALLKDGIPTEPVLLGL
jgi:ADP-ribose pyrophosphatase YjhB (NUDIX family)